MSAPVCPHCNGTGWRVFRRISRLYACGYTDEAVKCFCFKYPSFLTDSKTASAADTLES